MSGFKKAVIAIGKIVLLITVISFAGYVLVFLNLSENIKLPPVDDCQLQQKLCSARLPSGAEIEFEISPKNPAPTESLFLTARFKNINPDSVQVAFDGKQMKMGFLNYDLKKTKSSSSELIEFSGKGGLSVCILGKMEWVVLLKLAQDDNTYQIPFEMETFYNP